MKSGFQVALAFGLAALSLPCTVSADDLPAPAASTLTNKSERISYSLGLYIANTIIKRNNLEVDVDVMSTAIKDVMAGGATKMTEQQAQETLRAYDGELRAKREQQRVQLAEKNRKEGEAFLATNRLKAGIRTREVKLSETSAAEMQYKVLADGTGESPNAGDTVVMNLKGTLISGKECDNGVNRKSPLTRIPQPGLREALQLMKPGAKWQIFLPSSLAYGDFGFGQAVEPGATVIYEVELVSVETPQAMTSDIIEVPSKEMLEKGAQIKVHKPEELQRMMTNAPAPAKKP